MSQASVNISQQFQDGQVVPAALVGQNAVSKTYVDEQLAQRDVEIESNSSTISGHISDSSVHVTPTEKATYNDHIINELIHLSTSDRTKLDSVENGAQPNQNAFSQVNDLTAGSPSSRFYIVGGIGITVTTNQITGEVMITATGQATPGPHALTHITGGTDVMPDAVTGGNSGLMSGADAQFVRVDGETKAGAQAKADAVQDNLDAHLADFTTLKTNFETHETEIASEIELGHVKVDGTTITIDGDGVISSTGAGGGVQTTTSNLTYYVDASAGNDSNDGLTAGTAFKTIQHAVNLIPLFVNHTVTINVAAGTYTETVSLTGFVGSGSINVLGATSTVTTHTITTLTITGCTAGVTVRGFVVGGSQPGIVRCSGFQITSCTRTSGLNGFTITSSIGTITSCAISNMTNSGLFVQSGSTVMSTNNSGSGNSVGLSAVNAATIGKAGAQPSGTTAEQTSGGGVIR